MIGKKNTVNIEKKNWYEQSATDIPSHLQKRKPWRLTPDPIIWYV